MIIFNKTKRKKNMLDYQLAKLCYIMYKFESKYNIQ